jgi:endonuclease YncB( thermonuclease family)
MLKAGMATTYVGAGGEFGGREDMYRQTEEKAKRSGVGMWKEQGILDWIMGRKKEKQESPREYKTRMAQEEAQRGKK